MCCIHYSTLRVTLFELLVQGSVSEVAKELIPSITQLLVDEEKPL